MRSNTKQALMVTVVGVTLFVALLRLSDVLAFAAQLVDLVLPILAGGILALFLSVPMAGLEKRLGRLFAKARKQPSGKALHLLSFLLTLLGVVLVLVLALFVGVQAFDLSAAAQQKRQKFADPINATVVNNDQTASLGAGHTQLLAAGEVREDRLRLLAILAGKQGLATNLDIAVSGSHPAAEASRADTAARLAAGQYDPTAVYVTTDGATWENWQAVFAGDDSLNFFVADSCYFMVPAV